MVMLFCGDDREMRSQVLALAVACVHHPPGTDKEGDGAPARTPTSVGVSMPVTPRFQVSQTDTHVIVEVHVPYVRVSGMDFQVDEADFSFWCKPYLLKLTFQGELEDNEDAYATYDHTKVWMNGRLRRDGSVGPRSDCRGAGARDPVRAPPQGVARNAFSRPQSHLQADSTLGGAQQRGVRDQGRCARAAP